MSAPAPARFALVAAAALGFLTVGAGMAIFGPSLPVYAARFSLTTTEAGLLVSVQWVGCLLGVAAMYFLAARVSAVPGILGVGLGMGLLALSPAWPLVLTGAFVFGLGYGAIAALFNPRIMESFGPRGPTMLSVINAVFSGGAILSPYVFASFGETPTPVFAALAALSVATLVVAWKAGMTGQVPAGAAEGFRLHLPILALIFLAIGLEVVMTGLGPTGLVRIGMSNGDAARLMSVFFLVALGTRLALIAIADRVPAFGLFTFAMLWAAAWSAALPVIGPQIAFPALGVSVGLFFQGGYVTAARKMGNDPRVAAIILGTGLLGAVLSPLIYARLMDGFGPHGLFWLLSIVSGAAGIASLASYRAMLR